MIRTKSVRLRAWLLAERIMVDVVALEWSKGELLMRHELHGNWYPGESYILMQSTGCWDPVDPDREIYEDDIAIISAADDLYGRVIWDTTCAQWAVLYSDDYECELHAAMKQPDFGIIGDAYKNPDLLEVFDTK